MKIEVDKYYTLKHNVTDSHILEYLTPGESYMVYDVIKATGEVEVLPDKNDILDVCLFTDKFVKSSWYFWDSFYTDEELRKLKMKTIL